MMPTAAAPAVIYEACKQDTRLALGLKYKAELFLSPESCHLHVAIRDNRGSLPRFAHVFNVWFAGLLAATSVAKLPFHRVLITTITMR